MGKYLIQAAASATATITILGVLGYLLFPRCKELIWRILEADPEKYDRLRQASLKRNPQLVSEVVKGSLSEELLLLKQVNKQTSDNSVSIQAMRKIMADQTATLKELPSISSALRESSRALENVATMVKDVHTEVQDHGRRLERWDGYMDALREQNAWDGITERRQTTRRKKNT
jgi:hypothetical protein